MQCFFAYFSVHPPYFSLLISLRFHSLHNTWSCSATPSASGLINVRPQDPDGPLAARQTRLYFRHCGSVFVTRDPYRSRRRRAVQASSNFHHRGRQRHGRKERPTAWISGPFLRRRLQSTIAMATGETTPHASAAVRGARLPVFHRLCAVEAAVPAGRACVAAKPGPHDARPLGQTAAGRPCHV